MVLKTVAPVALALLGAPAAAQEIVPIISPGQAAEGVFYRSQMAAQARRQREEGAAASGSNESRPAPGSAELQKQACDNRPLYRRQYGEDHPQVQKLEDLCKAAGY